MSLARWIAKLAAVASSLLLVGAYVWYRTSVAAQGYSHLDPGSKNTEATSGNTLMSGSKSGSFFQVREVQPAEEDDQSTPSVASETLLPGSKSPKVTLFNGNRVYTIEDAEEPRAGYKPVVITLMGGSKSSATLFPTLNRERVPASTASQTVQSPVAPTVTSPSSKTVMGGSKSFTGITSVDAGILSVQSPAQSAPPRQTATAPQQPRTMMPGSKGGILVLPDSTESRSMQPVPQVPTVITRPQPVKPNRQQPVSQPAAPQGVQAPRGPVQQSSR